LPNQTMTIGIKIVYGWKSSVETAAGKEAATRRKSHRRSNTPGTQSKEKRKARTKKTTTRKKRKAPDEEEDYEDDEKDVVSPGAALDTFKVKNMYQEERLKPPTRAELQGFTWDDKNTLQQVRKKLDDTLSQLLLLEQRGAPFLLKTFVFGPLYLKLRLSRAKRKSSSDGHWYETVDVVLLGIDSSVQRQGHGRRLLQELAAALQRKRKLERHRVYYESALGGGMVFLQRLIKEGLFEPLLAESNSALSAPGLGQVAEKPGHPPASPRKEKTPRATASQKEEESGGGGRSLKPPGTFSSLLEGV